MDINLAQFKLNSETINKLNNVGLLHSQLSSGVTASKLCGFSNEAMALLYRTASTLLEEEHYVDAVNSFLFLTALEPQCQPYWLGLGMANQRLGNFEAAIDAYEIAATYQLDNPIPYFYLAKCLYAMHERTSARQALDLAIEYSADHEEFTQLKQQALAARERL